MKLTLNKLGILILLLTVRIEHIFEDLECFSKFYFVVWCVLQAPNSVGVTYLVRIKDY